MDGAQTEKRIYLSTFLPMPMPLHLLFLRKGESRYTRGKGTFSFYFVCFVYVGTFYYLLLSLAT